MTKKRWVDWCWDAWCIFSIIGIWPRFIEPKLISTTKINLPLPALSNSLEGIKILQLSDLHWHEQYSLHFSQKLIRKINNLHPDLIVFTGDFLTHACLENAESLRTLLSSLQAKIGCYAVLGNHDYDQYVTLNAGGDYDVEETQRGESLNKGFQRLFKSIALSGTISPRVQKIDMHSSLLEVLERTPFQLLHNATCAIPYKSGGLNITGLGEYTLGRCIPQEAFKNYHPEYPGLVLTHHPDSIPELLDFPGDIILSGHTHGGQVNLPFFRKKFTQIEQMHLIRGLKKMKEKWIYISRGVGGAMPFRWFSMPEITLFTLQAGR